MRGEVRGGKTKENYCLRHVLNTTEEECCVQREALMG